MSTAELRDRIGGAWTERADGSWRHLSTGELRQAVQVLRDGDARFAALVPSQTAGSAIRLSWHFDLGGALLSLETTLAEDAVVPSIADLYPGADWAEREARDYYALAFEGRATTEPLMLRAEDAPGLLLRREGDRK